jgi:uncharacterized protein
MKKLVLALMILLLVPFAAGQKGHLTLLAVSESDTGYQGNLANLYLEITPGSGKVFIETYPLTKLDTQISTRFAKEISCNFLDMDCSDKDFFYQIRSSSSIIGGPSAGSAISVLTVALLSSEDVDDSIAITGTINSGGAIGPVGGLKAKIDAADKANLTKVLIPRGERMYELEETSLLRVNLSEAPTNIAKMESKIDLKEYAAAKGIELKEVSTLNDAIFEFTGRRYKETGREIELDPLYDKTMQEIAEDLCKRTTNLRKLVKKQEGPGYERAVNLTRKSMESFSKGDYYSSASFCFGANIQLSEKVLEQRNESLERLRDRAAEYFDKISEFENSVEKRQLKTLTDLQAYIIVKERLNEAYEYLISAEEGIKEGADRKDITGNLAYGIERYNSALSWSLFLGRSGKAFDINQETIKESCIKKINEAEERINYLNVYFKIPIDEAKELLLKSKIELENENYKMCLFKASKAKAEADIILSFINVEQEKIESYMETKLELVSDLIAEQQERDVFPILGYSYYQYANTLKEEDILSSIVYTEYALELSNLDIYFKESRSRPLLMELDPSIILAFIMGTAFGLLLAYVHRNKRTLDRNKLPKTKKKKKSNKRRTRRIIRL